MTIASPRCRRLKKNKEKNKDEKRPRTAFTAEQLARLKQEFQENRYLTERRRQVARDLNLNESQIKIWFQNKRAKIKKTTGARNPLALSLMAQGLYNHKTVPIDDDDDDDDENMNENSERREMGEGDGNTSDTNNSNNSNNNHDSNDGLRPDSVSSTNSKSQPRPPQQDVEMSDMDVSSLASMS